MAEHKLPESIQAIKDRGYVVWADQGADAAFRAHFDATQIPVAGVRHVRVWGLQVDDERELPGHERTSIPDEELWQVELIARNGSKYEVNASFVRPAPE